MDASLILAMEAVGGALIIGGAYGATKQALNGTKDRVKKLEEKSEDSQDRLARIETKLDFLVDQYSQD